LGTLTVFTSLSVVVAEFDIERIAVLRPEADTPLIVDRHSELACAVPFKGVQRVPWRHLQVFDADGGVDLLQLAGGALGDIRRHPAGVARQIESLCLSVGE